MLDQLRSDFDQLEKNTVSDSFGGPSIRGRAPDFDFCPLIDSLNSQNETMDEALAKTIELLSRTVKPKGLKYILRAAARFAFCIELTNLKITSTKMKTRWMPGSIIKTRPNSFQNFKGVFSPGSDPRSASFDSCTKIFAKCLDLLLSSEEHLKVANSLTKRQSRAIPYESVFSYQNTNSNSIHQVENISLTSLEDIKWLIQARPIFYTALKKDFNGKKTKVVDKIKTKSYKTDRSQTGEVQTNRAKRWECLPDDFQQASIEDCWSVERKLLTDICGFSGFPEKYLASLKQKKLVSEIPVTRCPITLEPLSFSELLNGGSHGESKFQVGHLEPLKAGGRHVGKNIAWISDDGNRIQGSLSIEATHALIKKITTRLSKIDSVYKVT